LEDLGGIEGNFFRRSSRALCVNETGQRHYKHEAEWCISMTMTMTINISGASFESAPKFL
jgi:hypothetical protein